MKQVPHPYAGENDLVRMKHLLVEGKRVSPFSGQIHPGNLVWWNMKTVTVMTGAEEVGNVAFY
mgnify:CR=1 FL=1